jgi:hypothetical protein
MSTEKFARTRSAGGDGLRAARPVSGPPDDDPLPLPGTPGGGTVATRVTRAWERAYRRYGQAWETLARSGKGDPVAAREMAAASRAVAATWRRIPAAISLPWWTLAAVESAAATFDAQARDYEAHDSSEENTDAG